MKNSITNLNSSKKEIIRLFIISASCFMAGFALIYFFLRPQQALTLNEELLPPAFSKKNTEPSLQSKSTDPLKHKGQIVPAGELPEDVIIELPGHYLKCWDQTGIEYDGYDCDNLAVFEKRLKERLYVINDCKKEFSGEHTKGKLSLAAEVDFETTKLSFWDGAASDIRGSKEIGECLGTSLSKLPISGIEPKFSRYRIFFQIEFGAEIKGQSFKTALANEEHSSGEIRMATIKLDRVRVRKEPVDGEILGLISSPSQVRLLQEHEQWCKIVTPNNNEGWLICEALE